MNDDPKKYMAPMTGFPDYSKWDQERLAMTVMIYHQRMLDLWNEVQRLRLIVEDDYK